MIKRYNQFVKGINEEFEMGEGQPSPITRPAGPITTPDTPTRPRPTRPGITPTEVPSEEDLMRQQSKKDKLQAEWDKLDQLMNNEGFLSRAPEDVIEKNKKRLAELDEQLNTLKLQVEKLQNALSC